jgi:hypothetical protein
MNVTFQNMAMPLGLHDAGSKRKLHLLLARCEALEIRDIQVPQLEKLTDKALKNAVESNEVLRRLTSEGAEFIIDYESRDRTSYQTALESLTKADKPNQSVETQRQVMPDLNVNKAKSMSSALEMS